MSTESFSNSNSNGTSSIDSKTDTDEAVNRHPFTTVEDIESYDWGGFDVEAAERDTRKPHADPQILAYWYWHEGLSESEIAARYDLTQPAISYQMRQNDVPRIKHHTNTGATVGYYWNGGSQCVYPRVCSWHDGEVSQTAVHRLIACLDNDPHDVYGDNGYEAHHKTGCPFDNRPESVELVDRGRHHRLHDCNSSGWVIEDGEPRLREDVPEDATDPSEEWWARTDDGYLPDDE